MNKFIYYYNMVLLSTMYFVGITIIFFLPWYYILVAFFLTYPVSTVLSTIYHKLWAHNAFKEKWWVNWMGVFAGFIYFLGPPIQLVVTHTLHHEDIEDLNHPMSPKHPVRYRLFHWIYGHKFKSSEEFKEKKKIIASKFYKQHPWAKKVNLEKRLVIIHIVYLLFYIISPTFFAVMLLSAALFNWRVLLFNVFGHWYNKSGELQTVNSQILSVLFWNDEMLHKDHHDHPHKTSLGKYGPNKTAEFFVKLFSKN